jgi:eukaryotic-like serine/threonine-protein kinase
MAVNRWNSVKRDEQLCEIIQSYLESSDAGTAPDRAELIARHPEFAAELREFLENQDRLEAITVRLRRALQTSCAWMERTPLPEKFADTSTFDLARDPLFFHGPGRYQLQGEVARGGMGVIYRGRDTHLDRQIAFKFLLSQHRGDAEMRRRFEREARITGRLQHPGIVSVYDTGETSDGRPYFTMNLVKGRTLAQLLLERRDIAGDLPHFLKVFEQICQAVAYAHAEGVIHRDLKPANVMVSPFGVVQVMDWGLAKVLHGEPVLASETPEVRPDRVEETRNGDFEEGLTVPESASGSRAGIALGTPAFMPPEQARGEVDRLDERADVFGLGSILCVIVTGQPPYIGNSYEEIHSRATSADLAGAFARLDACTAEREVVGLAKRCLAPEPDDRFRDAGEVAAAVTAYLESDLRRAERDLVRFFDLSPDLFCVAGLDGYFRRVNVNFSRILGYTDAELLSRPFLDFLHPEDRERSMAEMEKLSRGLPVIRFLNRYRDTKGSYRTFEWTAKAIPEEGVIFGVAQDVTDVVLPGQSRSSVC